MLNRRVFSLVTGLVFLWLHYGTGVYYPNNIPSGDFAGGIRASCQHAGQSQHTGNYSYNHSKQHRARGWWSE